MCFLFFLGGGGGGGEMVEINSRINTRTQSYEGYFVMAEGGRDRCKNLLLLYAY